MRHYPRWEDLVQLDPDCLGFGPRRCPRLFLLFDLLYLDGEVELAANQLDDRPTVPKIRVLPRFWRSAMASAIGAIGLVALAITALNWLLPPSSEKRA